MIFKLLIYYPEITVQELFLKVESVCRRPGEPDCFLPEKVAGILRDLFWGLCRCRLFLPCCLVGVGRRKFKGRATSEEFLGVLAGVFLLTAGEMCVLGGCPRTKTTKISLLLF
jgi:hypothetical protein